MGGVIAGGDERLVQLDAILTQRFGVERARLDEIRREAALARLPYAQALAAAGVCTEEDLASVLAEAIGGVVLDLAAGAFDAEAVALLSEADARRFLMIPVAHGPSGQSLRVAFANPLDEEAVVAVEAAAELPVEWSVAVATDVLDAINREYRRRETKVVFRPAPKPVEANRLPLPVEPPSEPAPELVDASITAPARRLDGEASLELRHEALLLALIERGLVTRADYLEALKRLLGREG